MHNDVNVRITAADIACRVASEDEFVYAPSVCDHIPVDVLPFISSNFPTGVSSPYQCAIFINVVDVPFTRRKGPRHMSQTRSNYDWPDPLSLPLLILHIARDFDRRI